MNLNVSDDSVNPCLYNIWLWYVCICVCTLCAIVSSILLVQVWMYVFYTYKRMVTYTLYMGINVHRLYEARGTRCRRERRAVQSRARCELRGKMGSRHVIARTVVESICILYGDDKSNCCLWCYFYPCFYLLCRDALLKPLHMTTYPIPSTLTPPEKAHPYTYTHLSWWYHTDSRKQYIQQPRLRISLTPPTSLGRCTWVTRRKSVWHGVSQSRNEEVKTGATSTWWILASERHGRPWLRWGGVVVTRLRLRLGKVRVVKTSGGWRFGRTLGYIDEHNDVHIMYTYVCACAYVAREVDGSIATVLSTVPSNGLLDTAHEPCKPCRRLHPDPTRWTGKIVSVRAAAHFWEAFPVEIQNPSRYQSRSHYAAEIFG